MKPLITFTVSEKPEIVAVSQDWKLANWWEADYCREHNCEATGNVTTLPADECDKAILNLAIEFCCEAEAYQLHQELCFA